MLQKVDCFVDSFDEYEDTINDANVELIMSDKTGTIPSPAGHGHFFDKASVAASNFMDAVRSFQEGVLISTLTAPRFEETVLCQR